MIYMSESYNSQPDPREQAYNRIAEYGDIGTITNLIIAIQNSRPHPESWAVYLQQKTNLSLDDCQTVIDLFNEAMS